MEYTTQRIYEARLYNRAAHGAIGQRRKYTNDPYWYHTESVAATVMSVKHNEDMIMAALLHDVVEDTHISYGDILHIFGSKVAVLVNELTDFYIDSSYGNRAKRKELERNRLSNISPEAQTIKYADLIDNTSSIVKHDPAFAKVYMAEKKALLEVMTRGDKTLYNRAKAIVDDYYL